MPSGCCTNCRSKYSLFNPENGCSKCAYSFCSKCVGYKALLPRLADKPVSVCYACYQNINDSKIRKPEQVKPDPSKEGKTSLQWWGNDLPPPSLRQTVGTGRPIRPQRTKGANERAAQNLSEPSIESFEKRLAMLKQDDATKNTPTIEEIEQRLAVLRECDVELIKNPRAWFTTSSPADHANSNNPQALIEQARSQAALEEQYDPDNVLRRRYQELRKEEGETDQTDDKTRMSVVSGATELSEASKEEMEQIDKLMQEAEQAVAAANEKLKDDASVRNELKDVMANARQKSLDMEKTNDRVQNEISSFWDKQMDKQITRDDSEEEVDDETVRRIVAEAEATPDEPIAPPETSSNKQKKKGFFNRIFK